MKDKIQNIKKLEKKNMYAIIQGVKGPMRLEEGKNWVVKTCSFVHTQGHIHTHMHTPSCTQRPQKHSLPFTALFFKQLDSIYVCKAPSIPKPYPFIFSFQVFASADENRKRRWYVYCWQTAWKFWVKKPIKAKGL